MTPARSPEGQESHTPLGRPALDGAVAESAASGTRGPVLSGPPPHRRGPAGDCPSHVSPCPNSGPRSGRPKGTGSLPLPGSWPAQRGVRTARRRTSTCRALPPAAAGQGCGGGAHFSWIPCAHGHGRRSGQICQPWASRPPPVLHGRAGCASGPEGQHPAAASSRQSALPRRAPSGTASFCKYSGGPPSAPGRAGGSVRCRPPQGGRAQPGAHGQRRLPERGPEARARLPGRAPAQAARTPDEASGKRLWSPRFSALPRGVWRCAFGTESWGETRRQRELNLQGWELQAEPRRAVVALRRPEHHGTIPSKRLQAVFAGIPKCTRA